MGKQKSSKLFYSLRAKLTILIAVFIGLISLFIFLYIPQKFELQKLIELKNRAGNLAKNISANISLALLSKEKESLNVFFEDFSGSKEIVYVVAVDTSNNILMSYNFEAADNHKYNTTSDGESILADSTILREVSKLIVQKKEIGKVYLGYSLSELDEEMKGLKTGIGLMCLFFFIGGLLIVFLISSIITRPVKNIVNSAEKIAGGDLAERTSYKGSDELGVLAKSFNVLAFKLDKANQQVENLNRQLKMVYKDKIGELNLEINQRRLAEYSLRQSEEQFRLLFELAPIGMVITSPKGEILKVNKAFCTTLGYEPEELQHKFMSDFTYYEDQEKESRLYKGLLKDKFPSVYYEKRFVRKDNEIIFAIVEAVLVKDDKGEAKHIIRQIIDITERKKVETELVIAKEKAEESDRLKTAFLAQMSHEIRTPLNIILNATPLLVDELIKVTGDDSDPLIDAVNSASKRLLRTIDLILNMSSVQSGNYKPEFEEINLEKELGELVDEFKQLCHEKGLFISLLNNADSPKIIADKYTVNQIFQNLINNAIKYTNKGRVDVVISRENHGVNKIIVDVKDTGIGISQEYMSNLFSPFSQEDIGYKRKFEGNGLGLALVKKYVELNNSEITVKSDKDKGSVFSVIFDDISNN